MRLSAIDVSQFLTPLKILNVLCSMYAARMVIYPHILKWGQNIQPSIYFGIFDSKHTFDGYLPYLYLDRGPKVLPLETYVEFAMRIGPLY